LLLNHTFAWPAEPVVQIRPSVCQRQDSSCLAVLADPPDAGGVLALARRDPRPADLACDSSRVFRAVELEDQNQVPVVDFGDVSGTATGIHDTPHRVLRLVNNLWRHRVAQMQMVD
jgi:hypothetical protein